MMQLSEFADNPRSSITGGSQSEVASSDVVFEVSRAYQLEMYEASMKGNAIIVVSLSWPPELIMTNTDFGLIN